MQNKKKSKCKLQLTDSKVEMVEKDSNLYYNLFIIIKKEGGTNEIK